MWACLCGCMDAKNATSLLHRLAPLLIQFHRVACSVSQHCILSRSRCIFSSCQPNAEYSKFSSQPETKKKAPQYRESLQAAVSKLVKGTARPYCRCIPDEVPSRTTSSFGVRSVVIRSVHGMPMQSLSHLLAGCRCSRCRVCSRGAETCLTQEFGTLCVEEFGMSLVSVGCHCDYLCRRTPNF